MHISEGVCSAPVLLGGAAVAAAGTAIGLRHIDYDRLVSVAMLSAAFFVASLIHVPVGPSSVHLVLNGLLGLVLGWACVPAILVGLILQAVLFQHGGLTVLGVNTVNMALPALACHFLFRKRIAAKKNGLSGIGPAAFACGFLSVAGAGLMTAGTLQLSDPGMFAAASAILLSNLPVMVVEGFVTAFAVSFLIKAKPEIFIQISTADK